MVVVCLIVIYTAWEVALGSLMLGLYLQSVSPLLISDPLVFGIVDVLFVLNKSSGWNIPSRL